MEWTIITCQKNEFDRSHLPSDINALYIVELRTKGFITRFGIEFSDVLFLLIHFRVGNVSQLSSKSFKYESISAFEALYALISEIRCRIV